MGGSVGSEFRHPIVVQFFAREFADAEFEDFAFREASRKDAYGGCAESDASLRPRECGCAERRSRAEFE